MELNFIYSEKLLPWVKERHLGMFVYLINDYKDENSEVMYKYGLYFGGMFGWERLTNDFYTFERKKVDIPVSSKIIYYYNGKNQNYYPDNWDNISGNCVPTNNIQKNVGSYIVGFGLADPSNFQWSDESFNDKTLEWNILPYNVSVGKISVELNKYEMTYGDYEPYVVSVTAEVFDEEGNLVVRNLREDEYEVTKPSDFNVGDKNFIIKLKGNYNSDNVIKKVTVNPHTIPVPTNLTQTIQYDGNVHNPEPGNWNSIKNYCTLKKISGNSVVQSSGIYKYSISIKSEYVNNYIWSDGTTEAKTLVFNINSAGGAVVTLKSNGSDLNKIDDTNYSMTYNKDGNNPSIDKVTCDGKVLVEGKDYDITSVPSDYNSGSHEYVVTLKGDYEGVINVNLEVSKIKVQEPIANTTTFIYNGANQTWLPNNWSSISDDCTISGNVQTNANTSGYPIKITLKDKVNYEWNGGGNSDITEFKFIINKLKVTEPIPDSTSYIYNGSVQTWEPDNWNDEMDSSCIISDSRNQTNANKDGYDVTVSLKDINNTEWNGGGTDAKSFKFIIDKAIGRFKTFAFDNTFAAGNTVKINAVPIDPSSELTYEWRRRYNSIFSTPIKDDQGSICGTTDTINLTSSDVDYYYRVKVTASETDNCYGYTEYKISSKVEKELKTLSFSPSSASAILSIGRYELPALVGQTEDCDGTPVYTSNNSEIGEVIYEGGKYYVMLNGIGEVTITAKIEDSSYYRYTSATFTLKIVDSKIYYYGMADQNIETNYVNGDVFTLPAGYKETAESEFTLTKADTFDSSLYSRCRSWYVLVPSGTNVSFVESSFSIPYKKKSYTYIDEFGDSFDVYGDISGSVYSSTWSLIVTIK